MKTITHDKKVLRKICRERLRLLDPQERAGYDDIIIMCLLSLPEFDSAQTIMTYLSFFGEADTFGLARAALEMGKRLVVPKVLSKSKTLLACEIRDLESGLVKNRYGILEPDEEHTCPFEPGKIDFHVIPGMAFDRRGYRLGHGGGYYDRFLHHIPQPSFFAGIGYHFQILDTLPHDPWDVPVHCLVTEKEVFRIPL